MAHEWLSGGDHSSVLMMNCAGARRSGPGRLSSPSEVGQGVSAWQEAMASQAKGQVSVFAFAFLASAQVWSTLQKAVLHMPSALCARRKCFIGQLPLPRKLCLVGWFQDHSASLWALCNAQEVAVYLRLDLRLWFQTATIDEPAEWQICWLSSFVTVSVIIDVLLFLFSLNDFRIPKLHQILTR